MENEDKKELQMRRLSTKDAFKLSKIFREMALKDQVKLFLNGVSVEGKTKEEVEAIQKDLGVDLFATVFERLCDAENEVVDFLGDLFGLTGKEFLELPIEDCFEALKQFKGQNGFRSFLQLAAH